MSEEEVPTDIRSVAVEEGKVLEEEVSKEDDENYSARQFGASELQRIFRGYESRKRQQWRKVYTRIRRKLVFRTNAIEAADARRLQTTLQTLKSLVPHVVYTMLKEGTWRPSSENETPNPFASRVEAAMAFIDISGFVTFTEKVVENKMAERTEEDASKRRGDGRGQGAEMIMNVLNAHFSCLIDIIHDHGGDVLKFAGDALQVMFPIADDELVPQTRGPDSNCKASDNHNLAVADCVCRAIEACVESVHGLKALPLQGRRREKLKVKIGLSVGEVSIFIIGGTCHRYEFFVGGPTVEESGILAGYSSRANEVIISEKVRQIAGIEQDGIHVCATDEKDKKGGKIDSTTIRESFDHFDAAAALARHKTWPRGTLIGTSSHLTPKANLEVVHRDRRSSLGEMLGAFDHRVGLAKMHSAIHGMAGEGTVPGALGAPGHSFSVRRLTELANELDIKPNRDRAVKTRPGLARLGGDLGAFLPVCILPQIVHGKC